MSATQIILYTALFLTGMGCIFYGLALRHKETTEEGKPEKWRLFGALIAALRRRYARIRQLYIFNKGWRRDMAQHALSLFGFLFFALYIFIMFISSPWPAALTLRHILAVPDCAAARAVGLAPALRGEPGYYVRHDADDDGIACEPFPR